MFLLNNINIKGLEIKECKVKDEKNDSLNFSQYKVKAFEDINDPVKWQQSIRDEWI